MTVVELAGLFMYCEYRIAFVIWGLFVPVSKILYVIGSAQQYSLLLTRVEVLTREDR